MRRASFLLLLTVIAGCYESDVIDDAGFQFWCGAQLCSWHLHEGDILKVPTWHEHDYGVELVGAPVLLSQTARGSADCLRVELIADVDPTAMVSIEIDRDGDGDIDWRSPIDRRGFQSMAWELRSGTSADAVFFIRKSAEGRAVVSQLRAFRECEAR